MVRFCFSYHYVEFFFWLFYLHLRASFGFYADVNLHIHEKTVMQEEAPNISVALIGHKNL